MNRDEVLRKNKQYIFPCVVSYYTEPRFIGTSWDPGAGIERDAEEELKTHPFKRTAHS